MGRGNIDNLRPFNTISKEEHKAIASKGGVNSGKVRRRKTNLKKAFNAVLTGGVKNSQIEALLAKYDLEGTYENAMALKLVNKVVRDGDVAAYRAILDTLRGKDAKDAADKREQKAKINYLEAQTAKLTGEGAELEFLEDVEADIYDKEESTEE